MYACFIHPSIHPSVHPFALPLIHLSIYQPTHAYTNPPSHPSIFSSTRLFPSSFSFLLLSCHFLLLDYIESKFIASNRNLPHPMRLTDSIWIQDKCTASRRWHAFIHTPALACSAPDFVTCRATDSGPTRHWRSQRSLKL